MGCGCAVSRCICNPGVDSCPMALPRHASRTRTLSAEARRWMAHAHGRGHSPFFTRWLETRVRASPAPLSPSSLVTFPSFYVTSQHQIQCPHPHRTQDLTPEKGGHGVHHPRHEHHRLLNTQVTYQLHDEVIAQDYERKRRPGTITRIAKVLLPGPAAQTRTMYHVEFHNQKGRAWCTADEIRPLPLPLPQTSSPSSSA